MKLTDKDKITFGIHSGKALANVPASYLLWLWDGQKCFGDLKEYIQDNLEVLRSEAKRG